MGPDFPRYIFIILTAATTVGVLIQAGVLLGLFLTVMKTRGKVEQMLEGITEHALPMVISSKKMLEQLQPQIAVITANLVEISDKLRVKTGNIKESVDDVLLRTRVQTARVDEIVTGTLDGLSHASAVIQEGINVPLRQVSGVFHGLKAGFEVFRRKNPVVKDVEPVVPVPSDFQ